MRGRKAKQLRRGYVKECTAKNLWDAIDNSFSSGPHPAVYNARKRHWRLVKKLYRNRPIPYHYKWFPKEESP